MRDHSALSLFVVGAEGVKPGGYLIVHEYPFLSSLLTHAHGRVYSTMT